MPIAPEIVQPGSVATRENLGIATKVLQQATLQSPETLATVLEDWRLPDNVAFVYCGSTMKLARVVMPTDGSCRF